MRILILGVGVIGTTYGYVFKKAGYYTEHFIRDERKNNYPSTVKINILDGRYKRKGKEYKDKYDVNIAKDGSEYDFILISVSSGKLEGAIKSLKEKGIKGTLILFSNFWSTRDEVIKMVHDYPYIIGFPTAGGNISGNKLDCVLFDHIMIEKEGKTDLKNYIQLENLFKNSGIKTEKPYDMIEWIWIHMAINAGVTTTAGKKGELEDSRQLAIDLMDNPKALTEAVITIRETLKIVKARGVHMRNYISEILPYKIQRNLAGRLMKQLFKNNELTRRIMTLHNDINDISYGCKSVYQAGIDLGVEAPTFYNNMNNVLKYIDI